VYKGRKRNTPEKTFYRCQGVFNRESVQRPLRSVHGFIWGAIREPGHQFRSVPDIEHDGGALPGGG